MGGAREVRREGVRGSGGEVMYERGRGRGREESEGCERCLLRY